MRQQINLYHPIFRKQQKRFSAIAMVQAAGLVVLGVALLYGYTWWKVHALTHAIAAARRQRLAAARQLTAAQARFGQEGFAQRMRKLKHEIKARDTVQATLANGRFGNTGGYSTYFLALSDSDIPGLWITSFSAKGAGHAIELRGDAVAPDLIPRYLANLTRRAPFAGIAFGRFKIERPVTKGSRYVEFEIARTANPKSGAR